MQTQKRNRLPWRKIALGAAMALGAVAFTPVWAATPVVIPAGATNVETPVDGSVQTQNGIEYRNGGIGAGSQAAMKADAAKWPVRMMFSAKKSDEFVADVHVSVHNSEGKEVLKLDNAGPMTFVRLQPGKYKITATHDGKAEERMVDVGHGTELNFHWEA